MVRRVGLGCMRLAGPETVGTALDAEITVFDTAHAYGAAPGDNERLLAAALRSAGRPARVITKGGMSRPDGAWVPDGRAKAIAAGCEASLVALDGLPIDLFLLHAPDPRTPWRTSVRALARLVDAGLVARVGVANVTRTQLQEACALAPIAAVQVALSVYDDRAVRGGVLACCEELGIELIAHSPLGGPRRAAALARRPPRPDLAALAELAAARGMPAGELALAWVLGQSERVIAIPGATRPESVRAAARAATLTLSADELRRLAPRAGRPQGHSSAARGGPPDGPEVVLLVGIPGAGKSRLAARLDGHERLSRDELGGTLRHLTAALEDRLAAGAGPVVLDNTHLSRAVRSHVLEVAARHRRPVRCVWLDTPIEQAQVNLIERLLERFGTLPAPEQLRSRAPGVMAPTSQLRALRELEPPSVDEGFASLERLPFTRAAPERARRPGLVVAAAVAGLPGALDGLATGIPALIFDWRPGADAADLDEVAARVASLTGGPVETAVCPHGGGPPRCWCRPPLPGLALAFARAHGLDPVRLTVAGHSAAHRAMARALGAEFVTADGQGT